MSDMTFDLNAASWRHDARDEMAFVEALADRLQKSLPGLVRIERDHKWFAKAHAVEKMEVAFLEDTYQLIREGSAFSAKRAKAVRGIVISTKTLPLREWLQDLSLAIAAYAKEHQEARQSLEEFLL